MAKKLYVGASNFEKINLPDGYTQVEYIESNGTQYINTGVKPNQDTRVVLDVDVLETNNTGQVQIVSVTDGTRFFVLRVDSTFTMYQARRSTGSLFQLSNSGSLYGRHVFDLNKSDISIDGTVTTDTTRTFSIDYPMYICAQNNKGAIAGYANLKIYSCQIYDNDTMVRNFVPCKTSGGVVGLYDLVNNTFYADAAGGAFVSGNTYSNKVAKPVRKIYVGVPNFEKIALPDGYTQVEYIESTGTQYIDTGVKPNQDTRVLIDLQLADSHTGEGQICSIRDSASGPYWILFCNTNNASWYTARYGSQTGQTFGTNDRERKLIDINKNEVSLNGESVVTFTYEQFQLSYSMPLFCRNTAGTMDKYTSMKLYSCKIYNSGTLVRNMVPCVSTSGTVGLYDTVNNVFYENAGTGVFTAGVHAKTNARRIKKGYIGIGGIARPVWSMDAIDHYGMVTPLSAPRRELAATVVGNYALFGGGSFYDSVIGNLAEGSTVVDAYNESLTRSTPTALSVGRGNLAAATVGNYALFGGGELDGAHESSSAVDTYNTSLTKGTATSLTGGTYDLTATSTVDYAIFAGGNSNGSGRSKYVDAYNTSLTKTAATKLSSYTSMMAATSVGNYALIGGGYTGSFSKVVYSYDKSLTQGTATELSVARRELAATTIGGYALFAGGYISDGVSDVVDAYNSSLTRTTPTPLSVVRYSLSAASINGRAMFAGGNVNGVRGDTVDVYDGSLTRTTIKSLSVPREDMAGVCIGNTVLFGGGMDSTYSSTDVVEAYK